MGVTLWRHAGDSRTVLINRLSEVLQLFVERVPREYIDHTHKVNVLFVCRKDSTLILLIEALVMLQIAATLKLPGI